MPHTQPVQPVQVMQVVDHDRLLARLHGEARDAFRRPPMRRAEMTETWIKQGTGHSGFFRYRMAITAVNGGRLYWTVALCRPLFSVPDRFRTHAKYNHCVYQHGRKMAKRAESLLRTLGAGPIIKSDGLIYVALRELSQDEQLVYQKVAGG